MSASKTRSAEPACLSLEKFSFVPRSVLRSIVSRNDLRVAFRREKKRQEFRHAFRLGEGKTEETVVREVASVLHGVRDDVEFFRYVADDGFRRFSFVFRHRFSFFSRGLYIFNTLLTPTASAAAFGHRKMQAFFCDTHFARFFSRFVQDFFVKKNLRGESVGYGVWGRPRCGLWGVGTGLTPL